MVAPAVIVVLGFGLFPLAYALWVSFHNWNALSPNHDSVGFANYGEVIDDPLAVQAMLRTALFVGIVVPIQMVIGTAAALLVESRPLLRRIFFPVFLLPLLLMPIVVGYMWRQLWQSPNGMVNSMLSLLSGQDVTVEWLGSPTMAFVAIGITEIWEWTPFVFVVILAGLAGVRVNLREAAATDGAGAWATFRTVVWPAITPVVIVVLILRVLESANFYATVYAITQGGPGDSTYSVVYYIAKLAEFGRAGTAAAASFMFLLLLAIPMGLLLTWMLRRQLKLRGIG